MKSSILAIALLLTTALPGLADEKPKFELVDGDRVVLIGGTMIERDQAHGYLETRLTRRYPDRKIIFRNLGWSGDTVEGISRAGFGTVEDGYKHLVDHVLALKPTVLIIGYGANESFDGKPGLPKFVAGLNRLLKDLEPTKARLVFLSPTRQENLGPPLPDPAMHNADLALYRDALKAEAAKRGAVFVDLFEDLPLQAETKPVPPLTGNGLHLTPYGYWYTAAALEKSLLGWKFQTRHATADEQLVRTNFWTEFLELKTTTNGVRFELKDETLPFPLQPGAAPDFLFESRVIYAYNLAPGRYSLKVEGKPIATADADAWRNGVAITQGPEFDQVEALRAAINAKNELYFYRWRPQNETYLFGFRKHEQGQNAREIPLFDPLVEAKEAEIAKLRVPVAHVYELIREGGVGQ